MKYVWIRTVGAFWKVTDLLKVEPQEIYYFCQPQCKTTQNVIKTFVIGVQFFSRFLFSVIVGSCVLASTTVTAAKRPLCFSSTIVTKTPHEYIRVTYDYIRVTRVHTGTHRWHTNTYEYLQLTFESNTST